MSRYYYDLHIHSCLSPCAENDNTPNNVAGMAKLSGLDIVALTDHNAVRNCPAFFEAAERYELTPIAGMELTTSEDIHVICLFEHLSDALIFGDEIDKRRISVENRPDIFGDQLILDGEDNVIGTEPDLLSVATDISVEDVSDLVLRYGGICYPAHIDRDSNGIIAVLGTLPDSLGFRAVEFRDGENIPKYAERYDLSNLLTLTNSDAHFLTGIRDKDAYLDLPDGLSSAEEVRSELFKLLRGEL